VNQYLRVYYFHQTCEFAADECQLIPGKDVGSKPRSLVNFPTGVV